jgi:hypothetical protein
LLLKFTGIAWVDVYWHDAVFEENFVNAAVGKRWLVHPKTGFQRGLRW